MNLSNILLKYDVVLKSLRYKQNSSITITKEGLYYIERKNDCFEKNYIIGDKYLDKILELTEKFIDYNTLIIELINFDSSIKKNELFEYLKYLISNQILVSNIEPNLNQSSYLKNLLEYLLKIKLINDKLSEKSDISEIITNLSEINQLMYQYEKNINTLELIIQISNKLKPYSFDLQDSLIQVDTYLPFKEQSTISNDIVRDIEIAIKILYRINNNKDYPSSFDDFKERFFERYGDSEISLLEALDSEKGIGYRSADLLDDNFPIIDNLQVIPKGKTKKYDLPWNKFDLFLFNKYLDIIKNDKFELVIHEDEINSFDEIIPKIEDSFHVMVSILGDKENPKIHFRSAMLSSPNKLIGRFTHLNKKIKNLSLKISNNAKSYYKHGVYAEIMHTPKLLKHGNVLIRELDIEYEINFLSGSKKDNQLPLSDLFLFYKKGKLYLKSKSLNKLVYPQLNCAHNYGFNSLAVYNFLALFQLQNKTNSLHFKWEVLKNKVKFHPRVTYKKIILSEAYWILKKKDFNDILLSQKSEVVMKWRLKNKIPQYINLSKGDQRLFIDLNNPVIINLFIDEIKNEEEITIREFLFNSKDNNIVNYEDGFLTNEFIFSYINNDKIINQPSTTTTNYNRDTLVDNWLYYKIYCGTTDADIILKKLILPIVEYYLNQNWIKHFFFIRYNDGDNHIRFRVYVDNLKNIGNVMHYFNIMSETFISNNLIWKIKMDSYEKETERYGGHKLMEISELIFHHDSKYILEFIEYGDIDKKRLIFAVKTISIFIKQFNMSNREIVLLMEHRKNLFIQEFNLNKKNKNYLNKKYNEISTNLVELIFNFNNKDNKSNNEMIYEKEINILSKDILSLVKNDTKKLYDFISNHIHMHINRLFPSKQRKFELMIYYFMYKLYLSEPYLKKQSFKKN